jgi:hypothetical protein
MPERMSADEQRRWCLFTSAGDKNSIRLWLAGDMPRRWDLVVAYYGDSDHVFSEISKHCSYAFRTKGSKFQNLKKLVVATPDFFDNYSHVWVCDDDILMSANQIDEAFYLTESLGFWVAQPADRPEGRFSYWITCVAGGRWDYRVVNFVEVRMPIFRRDKLVEFLTVYDGSLVGWGIEHWFGNLFRADEFGRFAILDKVPVTNPRNRQKGGSEIDRLQAAPLRKANWNMVREKYGLEEYPPKVFAYCRLGPERQLIRLFLPLGECPPMNLPHEENRRRLGGRRSGGFLGGVLIVRPMWQVFRRSGWREAMWLLRCGLTIRRIIFRSRLRSALATHYARLQASLSLAGSRAARVTGFRRQLHQPGSRSRDNVAR